MEQINPYKEAIKRQKTATGIALFWHLVDAKRSQWGATDRIEKAEFMLESADVSPVDFWLTMYEAHKLVHGTYEGFSGVRDRILTSVADTIKSHREPAADPFDGLLE